jgi:hypothetical protein
MLFNKDNNGSAELKSLIGFIEASISFSGIETFIKFAENDIKKIIGIPLYERADNHYHNGSPEGSGSGSGSSSSSTESLMDELVQLIQLPVAFHAYIQYATSNDLSHSDKGRRIFVSDQEKPAFEWMIQRDEDNILSLAYKATDNLLDFLMENKNSFPQWTSSQAYRDSLECFIYRAEDFDKIFPIDKSRRLFIILLPFIREAERKYIKPVITDVEFTRLKEAVITGNLTTDDQELINMINVPLALYTMAIAVSRLPIKLLPAGIMQQYADPNNSLISSRPADKDPRNTFLIGITREADAELRRLQEYIAKKDAEEEGESYTPGSLTERHSTNNKFFRS